ncbi:MAG: hypothetical protein U0269_13375 [Polyangiales bacterium]
MHRSIVPALALATTLATPSLFAQTAPEPAPPSWSVQWNAPRACPSHRQLLARIRAQVGENAVRPTSVDVTVSERADEWIATVRIGADSSAREVRADSCDRVASAAAVVIGVALAPEPSPAQTQPSVAPIPTTAAQPPRATHEPFSITRRFPTPARIALFEEAVSENDAQWSSLRAAINGANFITVGATALATGALFATPNILNETPRLALAIGAGALTGLTLGLALWSALSPAPSPYASFAATLHSSLEAGDAPEVALDRGEQAWRRAATAAHDARMRASAIAIIGGSLVAAGGVATLVYDTLQSAPNAPPVPTSTLLAIAGGAVLISIGTTSHFMQSPMETSFERYQRRSRLSVWPLIIPLAQGPGVGIAGTL